MFGVGFECDNMGYQLLGQDHGGLSLMAICTTYMTHLYAQGADYLRILHIEEIIGLNEKCNSVATLRFFTVSLRAMSTPLS